MPPASPVIVWLGLSLAKERRDLAPVVILAGLWLWSVVVLLGLTADL